MINIQNLTNPQANRLAALAQEWTAENITSNVGDNRESFPCWRTHKGIEPVGNYTPTTNGQQAMDLLKKYNIYLEPFWITSNNVPWIALCEKATEIDWQEADTPERAITLAVIASKWGTEIDEKLLNG
jgi:hypothetical protein